MHATNTYRDILTHCRTIAVVGLSPNPQRESHEVAQVMQAAGYRIIPVNPQASGTILGEPVYPSLAEAARHERIDLVNIFRKAEDVPPVVDAAIAIGAKAIWMQLGIAHAASAQQAQAAGLQVVQDACIKIERARLGIRPAG